jgi:putative ABC transport system ATP-binding protein
VNALISWAGVSRTYGGPVSVDALKPTTMTVAAGDYVAIVGPSGSGKSTLLNVLGLLDRPSGGRYHLDGIDVAALSDRRRAALRANFFGFVFQAFHLLGSHSVRENVELGTVYGSLPRRGRRARAEQALEQVGLAHRLDVYPATLSGGERQRVAIARALSASPTVLICDEPTGNLDSTSTGQVLDLLGAVNDGGTAVVVVTHDAQVAGHAARLVETHDGHVRVVPS